MPIHGIASLIEGRVNYSYALIAVGVVTVALSIKAWASGRKNTWERDWAGKMVLVVADPNPVTLELLHQLLHLPAPPQVLYLPPVPSPLPDDLLTVLQTLRLSASTKSPAAQLHCEPLPRTPKAIKEFIKQWAVNPAGTGEGGRRLDAIIWADDWQLQTPFKFFQTEKRQKKEDGKTDEWTAEECRFHLLTAILPFILKAPLERPIRLVNICSPFYAAAIPTLDADSTTAQGKQIIHTHSPILEAGVRSWRDILLWRHLQRVLNALASATKPSTGAVPVPPTEAPTADDPRRLPGPEDGQAAVNAAEAEREEKDKKANKKITVQSNILGLSVIMPINRYGVLRPLMGFNQKNNTFGFYLYLLASPLIYLLTPSNAKTIQSVMFALSAPVLYDEDIASEKGVSKKFVAHMPRSDGVRGGSIVRNCQSYSPPIPEAKSDQLGQAVWENLEKVVEERLKGEKKSADEKKGEGRQSSTAANPVVVPDDVYA